MILRERAQGNEPQDVGFMPRSLLRFVESRAVYIFNFRKKINSSKVDDPVRPLTGVLEDAIFSLIIAGGHGIIE